MKVISGIFCGERVFGDEAAIKFEELKDEGLDYVEISARRNSAIEGVIYTAGVSAHFIVEFSSIHEAVEVLTTLVVTDKADQAKAPA